MPELRVVDITPEIPPVDFQLKPGKRLRVRFVDATGKPLPNVEARIQRWQGKESLYNVKHPNVIESAIPRQAKDGVYEWTWAPDDAVTYRFTPWNVDRRFAQNEVTLTADDEEHVLVFQPRLHVAGSVADAQTGKPIDEFTIIPVFELSSGNFDVARQHAKQYSGGQYDVVLEEAAVVEQTGIAHRLRIEAEGYRTAMSDAYRSGQPDPRGDFRLEPATPTVGRVFGLDGKPVARATVLLATKTQRRSLRVPRDEERREQRICHDRRTRRVRLSGPVRALYPHRDA